VKRRKARTKVVRRLSPQELMIGYIDAALNCAKTASRHRQSLNGVNFYANKMAGLRADATNAFERLAGGSVSGSTRDRTQAARELQFALKTTWANVKSDQGKVEDNGIFPLVTLNQTRRGYLVAVGRQMNGCYSSGWYDACAVMMRRLLESVIIEAFEARKIDGKIKDGNGDFLQLTALIKASLTETSWNLPRNVRKRIESLRDLGHTSAHNRYYLAKQPYIDELKSVYRETLEAFLHIAGLL
jgi:hypothetical protein